MVEAGKWIHVQPELGARTSCPDTSPTSCCSSPTRPRTREHNLTRLARKAKNIKVYFYVAETDPMCLLKPPTHTQPIVNSSITPQGVQPV